MSRSLTLSVIAVLSFAACNAAPDLVVINRSGAPIAFGPGAIVEPCSETSFTRTAMDEAYRMRILDSDESWIPAGAVVFDRGIAGQRIGAPKPLIVVISGSGPLILAEGALSPEVLMPACGGEPVGVE